MPVSAKKTHTARPCEGPQPVNLSDLAASYKQVLDLIIFRALPTLPPKKSREKNQANIFQPSSL